MFYENYHLKTAEFLSRTTLLTKLIRWPLYFALLGSQPISSTAEQSQKQRLIQLNYQ